MPVFHRPARVTIDQGSSPAAAIAAIIGLVLITGAAAAVITDIIEALAITAALAVLGSAGILAIVLRRHGVALVQRPPGAWRATVQPRPARAPEPISAPQQLAIEPPAAQLPALTPETDRRARED